MAELLQCYTLFHYYNLNIAMKLSSDDSYPNTIFVNTLILCNFSKTYLLGVG